MMYCMYFTDYIFYNALLGAINWIMCALTNVAKKSEIAEKS